jgi:hypothetical protein
MNNGEPLYRRGLHIKTADTRTCNIPEMGHCILVDAGCKTVQAEVRGKVAIVELLESINLGLQGSDGVSVIAVLDRTEKDSTVGMVVVVEVQFCMQPKV